MNECTVDNFDDVTSLCEFIKQYSRHSLNLIVFIFSFVSQFYVLKKEQGTIVGDKAAKQLFGFLKRENIQLQYINLEECLSFIQINL